MDEGYLIALLEQIAYNTQKGPLEREVYLKSIRDNAFDAKRAALIADCDIRNKEYLANVSTEEKGGATVPSKKEGFFGTILREQGGSSRSNTKVVDGQAKGTIPTKT